MVTMSNKCSKNAAHNVVILGQMYTFVMYINFVGVMEYTLSHHNSNPTFAEIKCMDGNFLRTEVISYLYIIMTI